jgi:hypothetical protein
MKKNRSNGKQYVVVGRAINLDADPMSDERIAQASVILTDCQDKFDDAAEYFDKNLEIAFKHGFLLNIWEVKLANGKLIRWGEKNGR